MRNTVEKNRESDFVVPPHCNNAKELGNRGGEENGAGNLGVLFPCIRQRFQAFSLVSERRSDGFETETMPTTTSLLVEILQKVEAKSLRHLNEPISMMNRNPMKMR
jgi:hypothetical protein